MTDLKLQFVCGSYDRIEPLRDGSVRPEGIDLDVVTIDDPRELFDRMMSRDEFDVAEMSSAEHFAMTSRDESPFIALPVFTSRCFRHSFMCTNVNAGIKTPKDLEGKRIGVPLYSMSAAIWCRGLLRDDYGVDLSGVTWVEGSMDHPGSHGQARQHALTKPTRIETNLSDLSLSGLLASGAIDATIGALMPTNFGSDTNILRLFPGFRATERDYYIRTGVHPIMHLVVIRRQVYERTPWIARSLFTAFGRAKRKALDRMFYTGAPKTMLPFLHAEVEETRAIFGDDPWPDGVAANRKTLECAVRYMLEDGLIETPPDLAKVFADVNGL
jgi:4,5-dihydroxyphthalate decarboxylase